MMNSGVEADDNGRFMRKTIVREMQCTMDFIQCCIEQGIQSDEFTPRTDAAALAQVIFCAIEGAIVISRVTGTPAPMVAVVSHCKSMLQQHSLKQSI